MNNNVYHIDCNRCKFKIFFNEFAKASDICARKKCWIKTKTAREQVAFLANKSPDDFLPIKKGEINIHIEQLPYKPVHNYTAY